MKTWGMEEEEMFRGKTQAFYPCNTWAQVPVLPDFEQIKESALNFPAVK